MNSLILLLAIIGQPPPDFSMLASPSEPIKTVTIEVPVYYATDLSGQEWYDKNKKVLDAHIKKENLKYTQIKSTQSYYYGKDKFGRDWRASTPEDLHRSLDRANAEVMTAQPWQQQRLSSYQLEVTPIQSFSSAGGGCANGTCPR
jgi:hypothetical protein